MNIIEFIPVGSKNAVSRSELRMLTGLSDRKLRREIQTLRGEYAVCNNGSGYFIADGSDPDDRIEAKSYYLSELAKATEILNNITKVGSIAYGTPIRD